MSSSYIKHGYLKDLYECFAYEGSEWGEAIRGLVQAYDHNMWSDEQLDQIAALFADQFEHAYEEQWLWERYPDYWEEAQKRARETREYWRTRSANFKERELWEEVDKSLPAWLKGEEAHT